MSISLDEMIKAGATLPEIQAELRKQVAARDEQALKNAQYEKALVDARGKVIEAFLNYFKTLGIEVDDDVISEMPKALFGDFEKALGSLKNVNADLKAIPATEKKLDNDIQWLHKFIASL